MMSRAFYIYLAEPSGLFGFKGSARLIQWCDRLDDRLPSRVFLSQGFRDLNDLQNLIDRFLFFMRIRHFLLLFLLTRTSTEFIKQKSDVKTTCRL